MGVINSVNGNLNAAKNNNDVNIEVTDIEDVEDKKDNVSYVNKNNTDVEDFDVYGNDITSLTPEQIESLVGTMTSEEYEEFIAGINKHYDNQIEYANTVIYGEGGYKELYDELSDKLSFVEEDYLHQVQIYYNELHELWENTDSLKNSGITYEEFEKMTSDKQAEFVKDKSDEASKKIEEIRNYKSEYDTGVKTEYPDLGVETFDDLIKVKNQLAQTIEQTDEDIEMLKNKKESAKYDYIYFTKDYKDYEFKTEFTEADIATLEFCKNGSEYDYDAYHEKYPNISITEFYMMVYEDDSNGKVYTSENTSVYVDKVAKLSKVNPSLAKTYQYIYDKDPNEAYDFIKDCGDEINKCQGMLDAQDFLDKYMLDEEGGIDAICNELNITREGLMDGLDTFVDGIYYSGEAIATLFGFSEENRVKSADEYKKMYLLYSLMSKEDKIKYGLITYDEDGNLVNTNPNSVIDFTKSYDGLMLDANYQLSQGIGNIAPSIAINYVLPGAGNVAMGVSAGGNAYHISMVEGNGVLDSIGYGIFTGTSEAISEKVLGGIQGLSDVEIKSFKDFLTSMGKEGIQESYQEIMDVVYRCTFMGEKLPESPEEWEELIHQVGVAGTYGMVTAGVLNSSSLMARVNLNGKANVNVPDSDVNIDSKVIEDINQTDVDTNITTDTNITEGNPKEKMKDVIDKIKALDNNRGSTTIFKPLMDAVYNKFYTIDISEFQKNNAKNGQTFEQYLKKKGINTVEFNNYTDVINYFGDGKMYLYSTLADMYARNPNDSYVINLCNKYGRMRPGDFTFPEMYQDMYNYLTPTQQMEVNNIANSGKIINYSEFQQEAIYNYTRCGGFEINAILNDIRLGNDNVKAIDKFGSMENLQNLLAQADGNKGLYTTDASIIECLDAAISSTRYNDAIVSYRGARNLYDGNTVINVDSLKVGDSFSVAGYQSSSTNIQSSFAKKDGYDVVVKSIILPNSGTAAYIESNSGVAAFQQQEVLIKRNANMIVVEEPYLMDVNFNGKVKTVKVVTVVVQ